MFSYYCFDVKVSQWNVTGLDDSDFATMQSVFLFVLSVYIPLATVSGGRVSTTAASFLRDLWFRLGKRIS